MSVTICQATPGKLYKKKTEVKSVPELRKEAAQLCDLPENGFRLLFQGILLDDKFDVSKLTNNIIMVVPMPPPRPAPVAVTPAASITDDDFQKFRLAFGSALRNPAFSRVSRSLLQRENMESLAAACPGLQQDQLAQAYLTRPQLLIHLIDQDTFKLIGEKHPALLEAAHNLAAAVHEEDARGKSSNKSETTDREQESSSGTYFLDEMSDEEMEEEWGGGQGEGGPGGSGGQRPAAGITAEQLAAALSAAATGNPFMGVTGMAPGQSQQFQSPASSGPSTAAATTPGGNRITADMFQAAMQRAMLGLSGSSPATPQNPGGTEPPLFPAAGASPAAPPPPADWSSQLATMRDMGIVDEGLARQALTVTGGDLQAAIELIFSGWLGD